MTTLAQDIEPLMALGHSLADATQLAVNDRARNTGGGGGRGTSGGGSSGGVGVGGGGGGGVGGGGGEFSPPGVPCH